MTDTTTQFDDLRLAAFPTAVRCADLFVRFTLAEWRLPSLVDDAADATSRLVQAAVREADTVHPPLIAVRLRLQGDRLVVEIEGDGTGLPREVPPELAERAGGTAATHDGGVLVWCELPLPAGTSATEVPLPRRDSRKSEPPRSSGGAEPDGEHLADTDPMVMQRILTALSDQPSERNGET